MSEAVYYGCLFGFSLILLYLYVLNWHRHFDVHITLVFVLVPITNLGYLLLSLSRNVEEALGGNRLVYIGGCYLLLIILLFIVRLCDISLNRWIRSIFFAFSTAVCLSAMTVGKLDIFYKEAVWTKVNGNVILTKVYGPMHTVFLFMLGMYAFLSLSMVAYSYAFKNQVSKKNLFLITAPAFAGVICYFVRRTLRAGFEILPLVYDFALVNYLIIIYRLSLYNVTDTVIKSLVDSGSIGVISVDEKMKYLGSNATARRIMPELNDMVVDRSIVNKEGNTRLLSEWIDAYQNEKKTAFTYEHSDRIYRGEIGGIMDRKIRRGYRFVLTDDTAEQRYLKLIRTYNIELEEKVEEKTKSLRAMHDNLVLSMAMMVESRDNSTGGHIRRTSEGVRILIEKMKESGKFDLSEEFCKDLIKAAPMHDLGKIAVDDAVLRKPGRFTPEEFEAMKRHAPEGARIVHEILKGTDDFAFHQLAENVAHYHHERWDGSGYPDGLKGEQIPLEARIMAIADVYDALVSKRVYKDRMSFEQADKIITEGMGTQFDPGLADVYQSAKPALEAYYRSLDEADS